MGGALVVLAGLWPGPGVEAAGAYARGAPGGPGGTHAGAWGGHPWHGAWHDGHWHGAYGASVGLYFGPGFYWDWPYGPYAPYAFEGPPYHEVYGSPYAYVYAYPNVTFAYPTDPAYDGPPPDAAPEPPPFRYYCSDPKGYYPQVASCTRAWLRVLPSDGEPAPGAPAAPSGQ